MEEKIKKLQAEILAGLEKAEVLETVRELEVKYLGRKGELTRLLRHIVDLDEEERREIGKIANQVKREIQKRFSEKKAQLEKKTGGGFFVDVTLPGQSIERGHIHPMSLMHQELEEVFIAMGFMVLEGPELESDYYNFEALNIPPYHPARDTQDTFYVNLPDNKKKEEGNDLVMRTHTSPMQIRAMQKYGAPLRAVVPGRVFRSEATDSSHDTTFYQLEGLMVDEGISIANLIAVMQEMLSGIFLEEVKIRVRPGYFPFVEPGLEVDVRCTICGGRGCASCKHSGWLEMVGAGMVHPRVLQYGGVDPGKFSGFAFGIGTTRLAMMKYGIDDIRLFNSGDLRFLEQF